MIRLYPKVPRKRQSFKGEKIVVVPDQSMSLKEILKRFVKKESLPIMQEGVYSDDHDIDLEKFQHEDPVEKQEMLDEQKARTADLKEKAEKAQSSAMERAKAKKKKEEEELFATWQEKQKDPKNVPSKQPD